MALGTSLKNYVLYITLQSKSK